MTDKTSAMPDLDPADILVEVVPHGRQGFGALYANTGVRVTHRPSGVSVVVDSDRRPPTRQGATAMSEELKQAERALDRMSGYLPRVYKDDIEIVRRALTTSQPAQAAQTEREAFEAWTATQPHGKYPLRRDQEGQYWADGTEVAWDAWQARASLPTQPAAQATPEPVGEPVAWRYKIPTHGGGTAWTHTRPQPECLIEAQPLYTHPAPGVPEIDYQALIHAAWGAHKYAQGTRGCIAFKHGAEWFRDIALAAAQAKGVDPEDLAAAGVMLTGRRSDHA